MMPGLYGTVLLYVCAFVVVSGCGDYPELLKSVSFLSGPDLSILTNAYASVYNDNSPWDSSLHPPPPPVSEMNEVVDEVVEKDSHNGPLPMQTSSNSTVGLPSQSPDRGG